jgi:tape measure domain-containing protein
MNNPRVAIELYVDDHGTLKIKQFAGEADAGFRKVESAGSQMTGKLSSAFGALGNIVAGVFTIQAATDVVMLADRYTQLDAKLKLVTDSSRDFDTVQQGLYEMSQKTGTSYATNAASYSSLGLALKSTGVTSKELLAITEMVNKSLTVSGATAEETGSFMLQFKQALGSGVLQGEEFKAMMEANSYFGVQLAKALDTDIAGLRKMSAEGKLTTDVLRAAFPKMADEINTAFDKMPLSIGRAIEQVKNAFGKVISEANSLERGTSGVTQAIGEMAKVIEQNRDGIGSLFTGLIDGAAALTKILADIGNSFAGWKAVQEDNLSFWEFATMNAEELNGWLKKNNADGKNQSFAQLNNDARNQLALQRDINKEIKAAAKEKWGEVDAQKKLTDGVKEETKARKELTKEQQSAAKDILKDEKKTADAIAAAQEEMYDETGQLADRHYAAEAEKLVAKAARWKQAGGDIINIENWLYDQLGVLEDEAAAKGEETAAAAMDRMQSSYRTLMDQLNATTQGGLDQLNEYGLKIQGLDGTEFTIHANLDGSGFSSTVNALIAKMQMLAAVSANAGYRATGGQATSWDGGQYDGYQVDGGQAVVGNSTTININQQVSRSDVTAILSEQKRLEGRK